MGGYRTPPASVQAAKLGTGSLSHDIGSPRRVDQLTAHARPVQPEEPSPRHPSSHLLTLPSIRSAIANAAVPNSSNSSSVVSGSLVSASGLYATGGSHPALRGAALRPRIGPWVSQSGALSCTAGEQRWFLDQTTLTRWGVRPRENWRGIRGSRARGSGSQRSLSDRERLLEQLRPVAFAIAYQMLGTVSEAEDVVQDALLRVHQALEAGEQIVGAASVYCDRDDQAGDQRAALRACPPRAICRRMAARADHHRRASDDTAQRAEIADSLSLAMLVLLESLSPEQRAALLLHDVFDYAYLEIAGDHRHERGRRAPARHPRPKHVEQRRPRFQTTREQREELAARFFAAVEHGDLPGLEAMLAKTSAHGRRRRQGPGARRDLRGRNGSRER